MTNEEIHMNDIRDDKHQIEVAFAVYKVEQNKIRGAFICAIPLAFFFGFLLGLLCRG